MKKMIFDKEKIYIMLQSCTGKKFKLHKLSENNYDWICLEDSNMLWNWNNKDDKRLRSGQEILDMELNTYTSTIIELNNTQVIIK